MIKTHILTCPICDKTLRREGGFYEIKKTCSNKHHVFVMNFNDWDTLLSVSLMAKALRGNKFIWDFQQKTLRVERIDGKSSHELPWFEPDFYLYEKLIQKLNVYVTFS
ncbi:MAG: hypothetical protein WCT07_04015 [Candidatus Paceibacterota bacterium]